MHRTSLLSTLASVTVVVLIAAQLGLFWLDARIAAGQPGGTLWRTEIGPTVIGMTVFSTVDPAQPGGAVVWAAPDDGGAITWRVWLR